MEEIWKDFPGFEGLYQISNLSRVRNAKKEILKPYRNKAGYNRHCFSRKSIPKYLLLGRMVATVWIENDDPKHKTEVNHKNGITDDDRIENLEWITPSNNIYHYYYVLDKGAKRSVIRMNMDGVEVETYRSIRNAIRWLKRNGWAKAADGNIVMACKGRIHYCYGHKWKYAE